MTHQPGESPRPQVARWRKQVQEIGEAASLSADHLRSSPEIRAAAVKALETLDAEIEALETKLARDANGAASELVRTIEELSALWLSLSEVTAEIDFAFDDEGEIRPERPDG